MPGARTPCFTAPPIALTLPASATATASAFATVILDKLFTLEYELQPASPKSGLSTGAKTGIGVGASAGVILSALGIAWIILQRRRGEKESLESAPSPTPTPSRRAVYPPMAQPPYPPMTETSPARGAELDAQPWAHELRGVGIEERKPELPAS
ncbi:MAG: hypothetical protein M1813_007909 [Trichoglossum hirsutum]|nr:MAG: hypothetical protein M1813_007909 [Trichoglossum hirsutum]